MHVVPIKTHKITEKDNDILSVIDKYLISHSEQIEESLEDPSVIPQDDQRVVLEDTSIIAVSSKIVSICEGNIVPVSSTTKDELAEKEADLYLPRTSNKYDVMVSIKNGMFIASAGIDESNGNGNFILWPKDPQASANRIREHLVEKFGMKNIGVIITDSRTLPLRWGVTGIAIAHSGFSYLKSYVGQPDIFGRPLRVEQVNVADTLAAAAVGVMGEGEEQTPLALITEAQFVEFQDRNPTQEELDALKTSLENDIYAGLLTAAPWQKPREK